MTELLQCWPLVGVPLVLAPAAELLALTGSLQVAARMLHAVRAGLGAGAGAASSGDDGCVADVLTPGSRSAGGGATLRGSGALGPTQSSCKVTGWPDRQPV